MFDFNNQPSKTHTPCPSSLHLIPSFHTPLIAPIDTIYTLQFMRLPNVTTAKGTTRPTYWCAV